VIVLDTHVLVWCSLEPRRLGPVATARLVEAWQKDEVAVCAISFWEVAMLQQRRRLALSRPVAAWRDTWLNQGLREIPLDGGLAIAAVELDGLHADPADRWIAATARALGGTLMTADAQLLGWQGELERLDANF
jgi:PIN domain nuclease of toxin-antitoxin system